MEGLRRADELRELPALRARGGALGVAHLPAASLRNPHLQQPLLRGAERPALAVRVQQRRDPAEGQERATACGRAGGTCVDLRSRRSEGSGPRNPAASSPSTLPESCAGGRTQGRRLEADRGDDVPAEDGPERVAAGARGVEDRRAGLVAASTDGAEHDREAGDLRQRVPHATEQQCCQHLRPRGAGGPSPFA